MLVFDKETIKLLKNALKRDGFIQLPAVGDSMFPFIRQDDLCRFEVCDPSRLKKGQIILFYSQTGQLVAHRFYYRKDIRSVLHFVFKGDTNLGFDLPVQADQLIGKLMIIEKYPATIGVNNFSVRIWGRLILTFPVLSGLLRKYLNWRQSFQHWVKTSK
ncbi:hypothetical protein JMM81_20220 [Bacillus sp. V3B]|nr:hypothetical protein [Bacillus sp. V3B]